MNEAFRVLLFIVSSIIVLSRPYCTEAIQYFAATGLSTESEKDAVNELVINLKADGAAWNQTRALYLFTGTTAATQKFNLKDPRDLDAAYRLTFAADAGGAHDSDGYTTNGTTRYADTKLAVGNLSDPYHHALGFFSNAAWSGTGEVIGANKESLIQFHDPTANNFDLSQAAVFGTLSQGLAGWLVDGPVDTSTVISFRSYNNLAGSVVTYHPGAATAAPTVPLYLGARNNDSTADEFKAINLGAVYVAEKMYHGAFYALHRELTTYLRVVRPTNAPSLLSNVVVFYGDSITAGQVEGGQTTIRWAKELCTAKGWHEWNCGMSGTTMQSGTSGSSSYGPAMYERTADIPVKTDNEKYLFISYGTNDILYSAVGDASTYGTQLASVIAAAIAKGWTASTIKVQSTYYLPNNLTDEATVNSKISDVCTSAGVQYLNTHAYMAANGGSTLIQNDHIHPNDLGVAAIKTYLAGVV